MKNLTLLLLPLVAAIATGCTSVSTQGVESRLQTLAFQPNMYVVQAGDSVETIAFRYQLSPQELVALNPGIDQLLRSGERINVRPGTSLDAEVRQGAFLPRNADSVVAAAPAAAGGQAPATRVSTAPLPDGTVVTEVISAPTQVQQPAPQQVVIAAAAYDPITGGHPNEQVVTDEFEPAVPSAGYQPVPAGQPAAAAQSAWVWPTDGAVARGFSPERVGGQGVDIAGVPGQDVRAASAGTVVYSGKDPSGSGGSLVILRHAEDLMTTYSHADKLFVTEDDVVQAGDPIASLGWNEASESVLSFEVRRDGAPLDPLGFIAAR